MRLHGVFPEPGHVEPPKSLHGAQLPVAGSLVTRTLPGTSSRSWRPPPLQGGAGHFGHGQKKGPRAQAVEGQQGCLLAMHHLPTHTKLNVTQENTERKQSPTKNRKKAAPGSATSGRVAEELSAQQALCHPEVQQAQLGRAGAEVATGTARVRLHRHP